MMKYNIEREFKKISDSFGRVKYDMNKVYNVIIELQNKVEEQQSTIKVLNSQVEELRINGVNKVNEKDNGNENLIVGNIESRKFHYSNCPYAKNIKSDNKLIFDDIEQAVKAGYNECSCIRDN
jgi:hypothetical protein